VKSMKMRSMKFSKNVTLQGQNIELVQQYMYKTRKNFSATLNIIIGEWDKFSIQIEAIKRAQQEQQDINILKQAAKAKVVKE